MALQGASVAEGRAGGRRWKADSISLGAQACLLLNLPSPAVKTQAQCLFYGVLTCGRAGGLVTHNEPTCHLPGHCAVQDITL